MHVTQKYDAPFQKSLFIHLFKYRYANMLSYNKKHSPASRISVHMLTDLLAFTVKRKAKDITYMHENKVHLT